MNKSSESVLVQHRLAVSLLLLRVGVAVVFVMWTLNKFVHPEQAAGVAAHYYGLSGLSHLATYAAGALQTLVVFAFIAGAFKTFSYGAIVLMHAGSTAASYGNYLDPWTTPNLLFFAAFPMLSATIALWLLRDQDIIASFDARRHVATGGVTQANRRGSETQLECV